MTSRRAASRSRRRHRGGRQEGQDPAALPRTTRLSRGHVPLPSRIWGVERGHEAVMTKDGSATRSARRACPAAWAGRSAASRPSACSSAPSPSTPWRSATLDYSVKPGKPIADRRADARGAAPAHHRHPAASTASCPTWASTSAPDGPVRQPLRPAAAGQDRRGPAHAGGGARGLPEDLIWLTEQDGRGGRRRRQLRHRGLDRRRRVPGHACAPASTSRAPPTWPSRSAWRPSVCWASTASSSTTARAWPACGPTSS